MNRPFEANYNGLCGACDERIRAGDLVRFHDDDLIHDDCTASAPPERKAQPICPSCFTELPVTGVCGVCE